MKLDFLKLPEEERRLYIEQAAVRRDVSAVSTGVFPCLTTCLGPRTAWQGFVGHTWPMTG